MRSGNSEIFYRGWKIEPFAIPCADGYWQGTCEIRKLDGTSSDGALVALGSVVRKVKKDAIADVCEQARHVIDSSCAVPYPANKSF
jgi:hypothetical protein